MGPIPSASTKARMESLDMVFADPFNSKSKTTPQVRAAVAMLVLRCKRCSTRA